MGTVISTLVKKDQVKDRLKCVYCGGSGTIQCGACAGTGKLLADFSAGKFLPTEPDADADSTELISC